MGYWLLSLSFYNESLSTNIFHTVHKIWIRHLKAPAIKLEDHFASVPEQRLLSTKMCQRAFKMVTFQLLKEEVSKMVPYNIFKQKKT